MSSYIFFILISIISSIACFFFWFRKRTITEELMSLSRSNEVLNYRLEEESREVEETNSKLQNSQQELEELKNISVQNITTIDHLKILLTEKKSIIENLEQKLLLSIEESKRSSGMVESLKEDRDYHWGSMSDEIKNMFESTLEKGESSDDTVDSNINPNSYDHRFFSKFLSYLGLKEGEDYYRNIQIEDNHRYDYVIKFNDNDIILIDTSTSFKVLEIDTFEDITIDHPDQSIHSMNIKDKDLKILLNTFRYQCSEEVSASLKQELNVKFINNVFKILLLPSDLLLQRIVKKFPKTLYDCEQQKIIFVGFYGLLGIMYNIFLLSNFYRKNNEITSSTYIRNIIEQDIPELANKMNNIGKEVVNSFTVYSSIVEYFNTKLLPKIVEIMHVNNNDNAQIEKIKKISLDKYSLIKNTESLSVSKRSSYIDFLSEFSEKTTDSDSGKLLSSPEERNKLVERVPSSLDRPLPPSRPATRPADRLPPSPRPADRLPPSRPATRPADRLPPSPSPATRPEIKSSSSPKPNPIKGDPSARTNNSRTNESLRKGDSSNNTQSNGDNNNESGGSIPIF